MKTSVDADVCRDYEAGLSLKNVATKHGVTYHQARAIVADAGIPIRPPKGKGHGRNVTQTERDARVRLIVTMVVQGVTDYRDITDAVNRPPYSWNVAPQTVKDYLTDARAILKERTAEEVAELRDLLVARLELLWREAPDTRTRIEVVKERAKLGGAYPAQKTEITGKDGGDIILYIPDNGRRLRGAE